MPEGGIQGGVMGTIKIKEIVLEVAFDEGGTNGTKHGYSLRVKPETPETVEIVASEKHHTVTPRKHDYDARIQFLKAIEKVVNQLKCVAKKCNLTKGVSLGVYYEESTEAK